LPTHPKPERETSREYLDLVKTEPCMVGVGCFGPIDPAHIQSVGAGGSDFQVVPLCRKHHSQQHQMGWTDFSLEVCGDAHKVALGLVLKYCVIRVREDLFEPYAA
jgi:hypothetical protein